MKGKNSLIETKEELETLLRVKEKEALQTRKELRVKDEKLKVFEKEFEINYDETISARERDRDRAEWFKKEVSKYKEKLNTTEGLINKLENKKEISDRLIKTLQSEKEDLKKN